jgi:hypothetical protein
VLTVERPIQPERKFIRFLGTGRRRQRQSDRKRGQQQRYELFMFHSLSSLILRRLALLLRRHFFTTG